MASRAPTHQPWGPGVKLWGCRGSSSVTDVTRSMASHFFEFFTSRNSFAMALREVCLSPLLCSPQEEGAYPPLDPPPPRPPFPPLPPLPMFEADSQHVALAPSVPRGLKLQIFWPGPQGDPGRRGVPAKPPPPTSDPPPPLPHFQSIPGGGYSDGGRQLQAAAFMAQNSW